MVRRAWRRWRAIAKAIGWFQSQVIFTVTYFVVIAPFAVAGRLFTDPLRLRTPRSACWIPVAPAAATLVAARQQF